MHQFIFEIKWLLILLNLPRVKAILLPTKPKFPVRVLFFICQNYPNKLVSRWPDALTLQLYFVVIELFIFKDISGINPS